VEENMKSDKTIKKLYDELIDAIKSSTETDWQEERIMEALSNYLNAIKE
jgi:hypothetical protein